MLSESLVVHQTPKVKGEDLTLDHFLEKEKKKHLTFSMYDLNHMGGGSSSGLLPFVSFTATCIKMNSDRHQTKLQ